MIKKKICLLGAFAVGKTSLTKRFVENFFDEKYLTTIGVRVDKKSLSLEGQEINLMIWDLEGEDDYAKVRQSYLRGAAGYILVADGTRPETLETALAIHRSTQTVLGEVPAILAMNKADLEERWAVAQETLNEIPSNLALSKTSAKSGENVDELFYTLSRLMLNPQ